MRQQPPLPGLVVSTPRRRAPVARPILPRPRPTFLLSRSNVALATLAVAAVARRLVSHPARARALARLARPAARGPAPRSRTAPIRERRRGAAAAHTVAVVAPVAAHVVISHRRHAATPRVAAAAATPTRVAIVTAHVIVAHPNLAVVSRRAAYAAPRASNLTSVTIVIATSRLATRTTHVSTLACLAGAGAGRLTSSRVPRRRATPCRRRRRSTVAVHTAIVVATVVVATARRLVARLPHTSTTATLHTATPVVAAAATRALKARPLLNSRYLLTTYLLTYTY